jgi:translation initiation factor IF-2
MGLTVVPEAGEKLRVVADERLARQLVDERKRRREAREQTEHAHVNLDTLFNEISAGKIKELIIVLKADVGGSAEAVKSALESLGTSEVKVKVIHAATGPVSDSDVMLAEASNGIIIAFNVKTDPSARKRADATGVEIRAYSIIYQAIEDVEKALAGMYEPTYVQVIDGHAEVRQIFKSSRLGQIAGAFVIDGTLRRGSMVRVLRNGQEIARSRCEGLKRFQDDVREVQFGYECGVVLNSFDKYLEGDVIEFYHEERSN